MALSGRDLKRLARKPLTAAIDKIDFVKILERIAGSESGRAWYERTGDSLPAYADQEEIVQRTIELTEAELSSRGESAPLKEIEDNARLISCRYDFDLHVMARTAVMTALDHLFVNEDKSRLFVSADRRELAHLDRLRQARQDNIGVVYLVNHSSHLDEFITDVVLAQLGIGLPLFAAGTNMMATPSVERILMLGSYVIVRKGGSRVYMAALFNYCRALSDLGKMQGIFLEAWSGGARTRDGSLRYPRRLVTLQGALATEKDLLVQPVGLSYSALPEDLSLSQRAGALSWINGLPYFRNWLRSPHRPIRAFVRALSGLYGRAYISFCRPKLLSELNELWSQDAGGLHKDEFVALDSMKEIARAKKVMASHLAARGLIRARGRGGDLTAATRAELEAVTEYHRRNFGCDPDLEDFIIDHDLEEVVADGLAMLARRKVVGHARSGRLPKVLAENGLQYFATHADRRLYSPSAKENIVVVGAGAWGYGLACLVGNRTLEDKRYLNSSLTLYDPREEIVESIADTRTHPVDFPEIRLPKNVFMTQDCKAAFRKATEVIVATRSDLFEKEVGRLLEESQQPVSLIIATRGFDQASHRLPIQIARDKLEARGRNDITLFVLSGPVTPAKLVEARGGDLVLAGPPAAANALANLFWSPGFSVYVCDDPVGVQLAGTMAEVYSLLGTYLLRTKEMSGRGQVGSFLRETSEETMKLALALGGRRETFLPDNPAWAAEYVAAGLGGPGANFGRRAGGRLRRAKLSARDFLENQPEDFEQTAYRLIGYTGIRSAWLTAKKFGLDLPRLAQAHDIFWEDAS